MGDAGDRRWRYGPAMHRSVPCLLCVSLLTAQQVPEGVEPNSSVVTATPLPCGREGQGQIGTPSDTDWWSITIVVPTEVLIETAPGNGPGGGPGGTTQIGDTILTLLDASGAPLRSNDDATGAGHYSRLHVPDLAPGTYFAVVERGPLGALSGTYGIDVRCGVPAVLGGPVIVAEGPENNDPRSGGTPTTITPDVRCNGTLATTGPSGDWDFYRFVLADHSFVRASVAATATHPLSPKADDPVLYLFDNSVPPVLLASSFTGRDYAVWDAQIGLWLAPGTYQIAVRGWQGSVPGSYYLDVRRTLGARAVTNVGGCNGRMLDIPRTNVGPNAPLSLERPVLGRTYSLVGSGLGANSLGIHLFGVVPTSVDLTGVGAPGCTLSLLWVDLLVFLTDALGNAVITLPLGEDPSLLGLPLETQLGVLDGSNPLGITFSNSVSAIMGN